VGCTEAWLGTEPDNLAARRLYESAGSAAEPFVLYSFSLQAERDETTGAEAEYSDLTTSKVKKTGQRGSGEWQTATGLVLPEHLRWPAGSSRAEIIAHLRRLLAEDALPPDAAALVRSAFNIDGPGPSRDA
jgi:hypothetical protein